MTELAILAVFSLAAIIGLVWIAFPFLVLSRLKSMEEVARYQNQHLVSILEELKLARPVLD